MIREENINLIIEKSYAEKKDLIEVFEHIREEVYKTNSYASIKNNYIAFFVYYLIENKLDLKEFKKVMSYVALNTSSKELSLLAYRFFDNVIDLDEFDKFNKKLNPSILDKMKYFYLERDGEKLKLNENSQYLLEIFNTVPKNKMDDFLENCYHFKMMLVLLSFTDVKKIINVIKDKITLFDNKYSFYEEFLNIKTQSSHYWDKKNCLSLLKDMTEIIPEINKKINNVLFGYSPDKKAFKLSFTMFNFLNKCGYDLIDLINTEYLKKYKVIKEKGTNKDLIKLWFNMDYYLTETCVSSIDKIDFTKINIEKTMEENYIFIVLLNSCLEKGKDFDFPNEKIIYMKNIIEQIETNVEFQDEIYIDLAKNYYFYKEMNDKLEVKEHTNKKVKI